MPAYIIAEHTITDPAKFEEYRIKVGPIIAKHGGRYITKAGSHAILEEENAVWQPERVVIIEFPDMAAPECLVYIGRVSAVDPASTGVGQGYADHA